MTQETIVIVTEEVKVSELRGREKKIYDYAYTRGFREAINENKSAGSRFFLGVCFLALFIVFILKVS